MFDDASLEKLHGHNYYVSLDVEFRGQSGGLTVEFRHLKRIMQSLCESLDEKTLLPSESPYLKIAKQHDQFEARFSGSGFSKTYSFPCEDVEILAVPNITSEMLAQYLCEQFCHKLQIFWKEMFPARELSSDVISVSVGIEETRGQAVTYIWEY